MAKRPIPEGLAELRESTKRPRQTVVSGGGRRRPALPRHLSPAAVREWRRVVKLLDQLGTLDQVDADVISLYASMHAQWVECNQRVLQDGMIVVSPNGYPQQSPHFTMATGLAKQMRGLLTELGMTPAARTRVGMAAPAPVDEYADFLADDDS